MGLFRKKKKSVRLQHWL